MKRYIIDTDIGDDIDDVFALLAAIKGGLPVAGVTTVFRNSNDRAKMAKYFISMENKNIPVYAGADEPLIQSVKNIFPPEVLAKDTAGGKYKLPQWNSEIEREEPQKTHAVDFIIEEACRGEGLVILALGPMTNLALAIRKAPDIAQKIAKIVLVGGCYNERLAEWNVACDPESMHIVISSGIPVEALGLEIVKMAAMSDELLAKLPSLGKEGEVLSHFIDQWNEHYGVRRPTLFDTLAVFTELDPLLVGFENKYVAVGLMGDEENRYITSVYNEPRPFAYPVKVGVSTSFARWQQLFKRIFFS